MPEAPAFVIEEITGQRRSVALRGRALPHQGSASWGGRMRTKSNWYAGNPEATLQVLGPEELPTTIEGWWKDRYLSADVSVTGFDAPTTSEELVAIFDAIRIAGQALRVSWGPHVREGVLTKFEVKPIRVEDHPWEAEFTWYKRDGVNAPRATTDRRPESEVRAQMTAMDDVSVQEPVTVVSSSSASFAASLTSIRGACGKAFDAVRTIQGQAALPVNAVQQMTAAASSIRSEVETLLVGLVDAPYLAHQLQDGVVAVLNVEGWRRSLGLRVHDLRATVQRQAQDFARRYRPPGSVVIVMPAGTTLRKLAARYYGDADLWYRIAEANDITTSTPAPGTRLLIPPATPRG